jgi:GNAT superfamily N-acetyltransferase
LKVEFVPVRWWQVADFIRLNFAIMRGHDPWADRILSRPWAPSSLLEYAYMLAEFPSSDAYFLVASDKRVGVLWMTRRSRLLYMLSLGLSPDFRTDGVGMRIARLLVQLIKFVEDYARRHKSEILVLRMAGSNLPSQRMARLFGCRPLGLATTDLTISPVNPSESPIPEIEVKPLGKSEAAKAWRHWKLYAVERVAGPAGVKVAADFIKSFYWVDALPAGKHLALYQNGQEIGFAFARQREGELYLGLFPDAKFFPGDKTSTLVNALAVHLKSPVHHLTLTLEHAAALTESAPFKHKRHRDKERLTMFQLAEWRSALAATSVPDGGQAVHKVQGE